MSRTIRVFAPATVANVACGFDILGFAVDKPGDEVEITLHDTPGVRLTAITGDEGRLSYEADVNTASVAVAHYLRTRGLSHLGADIQLHKQMPFGSGMGSSAASAAAAVFAIHTLLGRDEPREALLPAAMEGERVACGTAHADNVGPSLLGGFVLIRSYDPLDVVRIPTPEGLACALVHPHLEVPTRDAREILRQHIRLRDAIVQWGNVAGLIAGLMQNDFELIGRSLQDVIVEPVRSLLIPGFDQVKQAALSAGALGCGISGSGPSVFALCRNLSMAHRVGKAMQTSFGQLGIPNDTYVSGINRHGPIIRTSVSA